MGEYAEEEVHHHHKEPKQILGHYQFIKKRWPQTVPVKVQFIAMALSPLKSLLR